MKITNLESFIVDAGWRPWIFVKVETDEGITGYGECSVARGPYGVTGAIEDLKPVLIGTDPRAHELRFWDMSRHAISEPLGIRAKAIAGIELALLDVKAKALGISVVELFGGPTRDKVRLYWSHCATTRALYPEMGKPPIRTMADITALGKEVVRRGFTALKTNIVFPGDPARVHFDGFGGGLKRAESTDLVASTGMIKHIETLIGTFRESVGPEVDICLDLNFNFRPESCMRIAKVLEPFNLLWLEIDMYHPEALRQIKDSTSTKICTGENQIYMQDFLPYFQARCADVFMIDAAWMGFSQSKKVGDLANIFEFNVAPHNYYSHLSTFISASLCGALSNVRILEIDVDDVPLREELVTNLPDIKDGYIKLPTGPGWGTDLKEDIARKHPWHKPKERW